MRDDWRRRIERGSCDNLAAGELAAAPAVISIVTSLAPEALVTPRRSGEADSTRE